MPERPTEVFWQLSADPDATEQFVTVELVDVPKENTAGDPTQLEFNATLVPVSAGRRGRRLLRHGRAGANE